MHLIHRGYGIAVSSDGVPLPHYGTRVLSRSTVVCYIPSEAGKEFTVHFADLGLSPKAAGIIDIYCDGRFMCGNTFYPGTQGKVTHVPTSGRSGRPFVFSKVAISTDDMEGFNHGAESLGLIEARIYTAFKTGRIIPNPQFSNVHEIGAVSERSKAIGLNKVSLGTERPYQSYTDHFEWLRIEPLEEPCASFQFRHRPAELLQAMDIMPAVAKQQPEPTPDKEHSRKHSLPPVETLDPSRKRSRIDQYFSRRPSSFSPAVDTKPHLESPMTDTSNTGRSGVAEASRSSADAEQDSGPAPSESDDAIMIQTLQDTVKAAQAKLEQTIKAAQSQLEETMKATRAQLETIKSRQTSATVQKRSKREASPVRKLGKAIKGEVIDLT
ncbi:hypothetical protein BC834DRAFT_857113 [Gloeopeniophorella convolvens]|nr:hypothetical protein BC834DRAFT_857113 [Gloeopeniophorella convolvens]